MLNPLLQIAFNVNLYIIKVHSSNALEIAAYPKINTMFSKWQFHFDDLSLWKAFSSETHFIYVSVLAWSMDPVYTCKVHHVEQLNTQLLHNAITF